MTLFNIIISFVFIVAFIVRSSSVFVGCNRCMSCLVVACCRMPFHDDNMWLRVGKSLAPRLRGAPLVLWSLMIPVCTAPSSPQPLVLPLLLLQPCQNFNLFATSTSQHRDQDNLTTLLPQLILGVSKFSARTGNTQTSKSFQFFSLDILSIIH